MANFDTGIAIGLDDTQLITFIQSNNNVISNCQISNCDSGIRVYLGNKNIIHGNTIVKSQLAGIVIDGNNVNNKDTQIINNKVFSSLFNGIQFFNTDRTIVKDNVLNGNGLDGILFGGGDNNLIIDGNIVTDNINVGIGGLSDSTAKPTITRNIVVGNGGSGQIVIDGPSISADNTVTTDP